MVVDELDCNHKLPVSKVSKSLKMTPSECARHRLHLLYMFISLDFLYSYLLSFLTWSPRAVVGQTRAGQEYGQEGQFILDCPLNSIDEVDEKRILARFMSMFDNMSQPLYESVGAKSNFLNRRLLQ